MFDKFFQAFIDNVKREKPRDMLYIVDEKAPKSTVFIVSLQHVLVLLMGTIVVVMTGRAIGMEESEVRGFLSTSIIILGVATLLQGLRTRFSSGHLVTHTPSYVSASIFAIVAANFGIGAAAGGIILSGLIIIFLSRFLSKLQVAFPPEVTGILLILLALSIIEKGVSRYTGLLGSSIDLNAVMIASTVLGAIVGFSVWANEKIRVFAVLIGTILGLIVAAIVGKYGGEQLAEVASQPLISFPFSVYQIPTPTLVFAATIPILIIEIISAIYSIGTGIVIDKMNNSQWRRTDMPMISRLISCQGIGVLLNGLTGTIPSGTSSASLGLAHASGVATRSVAAVTGMVLIVISLCPQISTFITLLPQPVLGAIVVYTAGYMFVSGAQLIMSRMINSRRKFMIGISMVIGSSIILMPELTANVPPDLKPILGSGLSMGVLAAIALNLLFRIGVAQQSEITLDGNKSGSRMTEFLEECGADWGARQDIISRASTAVGEALEELNRTKLIEGMAKLKAQFDEYKLILTLTYPGKKIPIEPQKQLDLDALLDEEGDAGLDAAISNISGVLIKNLADKVTSSEVSGNSELKLVFEH
jgi:xanthine/uracil permease